MNLEKNFVPMKRRNFIQGLGAAMLVPGLDLTAAPNSRFGKIDVFVAAGKLGRTLMSIDDGESWIHDKSDDDNARCWCDQNDPRYVECDHDPRSFTGLDASEDGWFYAQYGWGAPGTIRRSQNFIDWEVIRSGSNGGGLAVSGKTVVSLWNGRRYRSTNQGKKWTEVKDKLRMDGHP
ncbi:MAG: hypothetical protein NE327_04025, partial [Lentisphaeraceae bacterium]|nr:hypothetical protein [Lentisphaeraceae bacterium]